GPRLAGGAHATGCAAVRDVETAELDTHAAVDAVGAGELEAWIRIGIHRAAAEEHVDAWVVEIAVRDDGHRRRAVLEPGIQQLRADGPAAVAAHRRRSLRECRTGCRGYEQSHQ